MPRMDENAIKLAAQTFQIDGKDLDCKRVSEGGEHEVWYIGQDYILRGLACSKENKELFLREGKLTELLGQYLQRPDLVPQRLKIGLLPERNYIYSIEKRIRGVSLENKAPTIETERDLIDFFRDIAAIPVQDARDFGLPAHPLVDIDQLVKDTYETWDRLVRHGYSKVSQGVVLKNHLNSNIPLKHIGSSLATLLHADLKGEHIFIDPDTAELQGIIDWSDAQIGDPAVDIEGLAISVGQSMAQRIGTALGLHPGTLERGMLLSQCNTILRLNDRLIGDDEESPIELLVRQFRRAFENTALQPVFDNIEYTARRKD